MNKPELGVKRDCPNCGARFYDLNREPAHCPKCAHEFVPEMLLKPRKRREDEVAEKEEALKPATETSLEQAEKERAAPASKKKAPLDDEAAPGEEEEIEDIDVDLDVDLEDAGEEDDTILEEDEDEDDVSTIVSPEAGEER